MGFYRQEYWSGLPFPSSGDLPNPGIKPRPPALQADSLPAEALGKRYIVYFTTLPFFLPGDAVMRRPPSLAGICLVVFIATHAPESCVCPFIDFRITSWE